MNGDDRITDTEERRSTWKEERGIEIEVDIDVTDCVADDETDGLIIFNDKCEGYITMRSSDLDGFKVICYRLLLRYQLHHGLWKLYQACSN